MKQAVYKYAFPLIAFGGRVEVNLPIGARILDVAEQRGEFQIWALVKPDFEATEPRRFVILPTGPGYDDSKPGWALGDHVTTLHLHDGDIVLHVFEAEL